MELASLQQFFSSSPAIRLLRSPNAAWVVCFLYQAFKASGKITRPENDLVNDLEQYLEALPGGDPYELDQSPTGGTSVGESGQRARAEMYLANWCAVSSGWLKRFIDDVQPEPSYQLTAASEQVLSFLTNATREQSFIGTQSRLRSILTLLDSVACGSAEGPEERVKQLRQQRFAIDQEILQLESDPSVARMSATELREHFSLAVQQLEQLKSEFRGVEDRFKGITRSVQQKILSEEESRGDILSFALDREDLLNSGDQGQSFFEFLRLVHSPENQDKIGELVHRLKSLDSLASQHSELESLRTMVPTLLLEAEKVLRTTQHLSATLGRLLDKRSTRHHRQLTHLLRDIISSATQLATSPPSEIGVEVETELDICSPMDRLFWSPQEPFEEVELQIVDMDAEAQSAALERLAGLQRLDWQALRRNITLLTQAAGEVTLGDLLERFPVDSGAIELLGYLQIAHDDGHLIDRQRPVEIEATWGDRTRRLRLPRVVFLPKQMRRSDRSRSSKQDQNTLEQYRSAPEETFR